VNGLPSDHFMPLRSLKVYSVASGLAVHDSATLGMTVVQFRSHRTR